MPRYGIKIDEASILAKVNKAIAQKGRAIAHKKAYDLFYRARNAMLRDFDKHPVTNELKTAGRSGNISLTTEGYGNLYAYLGFHDGTDPTAELRGLLQVGTNFQYTGHRQGAWYFRILAPAQTAIEGSTPSPYDTGASWVDHVEKGLDNLESFLYKKGYGRSSQGFQAPYEINEGYDFQPTPYLSEIMENFRDRINGSRINDL